MINQLALPYHRASCEMTGSANFFVKSPNIALEGVEPSFAPSEGAFLPIGRKSRADGLLLFGRSMKPPKFHGPTRLNLTEPIGVPTLISPTLYGASPCKLIEGV